VNPQVHAFDNATLVENLEAQGLVIESGRQFLGSVPVVVSPVTLKPRLRPGETPEAGQLPRDADPRQRSLLGAGWTAISLKYLAEAGAESVTYYEATGWRGVMDWPDQAAGHSQFGQSLEGVYPLYHVFADVGEFSGGSVVPVVTTHSLRADGFAIRQGARTRILVANLGPDTETIQIDGLPVDGTLTLKPLDETNAEYAMKSPDEFRRERGSAIQASAGKLELKLFPYALVRIDISQ
jgi:hypothetical protein